MRRFFLSVSPYSHIYIALHARTVKTGPGRPAQCNGWDPLQKCIPSPAGKWASIRPANIPRLQGLVSLCPQLSDTTCTMCLYWVIWTSPDFPKLHPDSYQEHIMKWSAIVKGPLVLTVYHGRRTHSPKRCPETRPHWSVLPCLLNLTMPTVVPNNAGRKLGIFRKMPDTLFPNTW